MKNIEALINDKDTIRIGILSSSEVIIGKTESNILTYDKFDTNEDYTNTLNNIISLMGVTEAEIDNLLSIHKVIMLNNKKIEVSAISKKYAIRHIL